jgi:hypothetical protein
LFGIGFGLVYGFKSADEQLVLIGEDGAKWFCGANSSFIVNGKFWVNNHAHVVRPNKNTIHVVSNTYCVVFLFCFSSSCVLYIACFSGLQCNLFYTFL